MEFDEQGNIYVVEMPDYPYRPEPGKQKEKNYSAERQQWRWDHGQSMVFADSLMGSYQYFTMEGRTPGHHGTLHTLS